MDPNSVDFKNRMKNRSSNSNTDIITKSNRNDKCLRRKSFHLPGSKSNRHNATIRTSILSSKSFCNKSESKVEGKSSLNTNFKRNVLSQISDRSNNQSHKSSSSSLSSLSRAIDDLSFEIAQLDFRPGVHELIKEKENKNKIKSQSKRDHKNAFKDLSNKNSVPHKKSQSSSDQLLPHVDPFEIIDIENSIPSTSGMINKKSNNKENVTAHQVTVQALVHSNPSNATISTSPNLQPTLPECKNNVTERNKAIVEKKIITIINDSVINNSSSVNSINSSFINRSKMDESRRRKSSVTENNEAEFITNQPGPSKENHIFALSPGQSIPYLTPTSTKSTFQTTFTKLFHTPKLKTPKTPALKTKSSSSNKNKFKNKTNTSKSSFGYFGKKMKFRFKRYSAKSICLPKLNFPISPKSENNAKQIQLLVKEVQIQQTIIHQANKALFLCQYLKEFKTISEEVESERSRLQGNMRIKATLEEIERLIARGCGAVLTESSESAELNIHNIVLNVKEPKCDDSPTEWFVVVILHRLFVWVSKAVECPFNKMKVLIPDNVLIPDVNEDFKIKIQIYSLKFRLKPNSSNCDAKFSIVPCNSCFSSQRIFGKKVRMSNNRSKKDQLLNTLNTEFNLVGNMEIRKKDLFLRPPWTLNSVSSISSLHSLIDFSLSCKINIPIQHSGFVNYGILYKGYTEWNRRWGVIEGHELQLWNYPLHREEYPLLIIDLINCITKKVRECDYNLCAKPKTLLVETIFGNTHGVNKNVASNKERVFQVRKNLFSFDKNEDFDTWTTKINEVLSAVYKWNRVLYEDEEIEFNYI